MIAFTSMRGPRHGDPLHQVARPAARRPFTSGREPIGRSCGPPGPASGELPEHPSRTPWTNRADVAGPPKTLTGGRARVTRPQSASPGRSRSTHQGPRWGPSSLPPWAAGPSTPPPRPRPRPWAALEPKRLLGHTREGPGTPHTLLPSTVHLTLRKAPAHTYQHKDGHTLRRTTPHTPLNMKFDASLP